MASSSEPSHASAPLATELRYRLSYENTKWRDTILASRGALLVLLSEAFGGLMAATTRALELPRADGTPGMETEQILFVRFGITALLSWLYMWWAKVEHAPLGPPEIRKLLVLRGCAGFCGVYGFYFSLRYLPMTEAIVIFFITPIITAYAASLFLGEPFSRKQLYAGIFAFVGIIIVSDPLGFTSRPTNDSLFDQQVTTMQRFIAIGAGLLSDFAAAGAYTFIRLIGTKVHTLISVNYYAMIASFLSCLVLFLPIFPEKSFGLPHGLREWLLLLGIGLFGFLLQFLLTAGLVMDRSSKATNMMYSQIVFAIILEWAIWGTIPTWTSWVGGGLVVASVIWGNMQKEQKGGKVDGEAYIGIPSEDLDSMTDGEPDVEDDETIHANRRDEV